MGETSMRIGHVFCLIAIAGAAIAGPAAAQQKTVNACEQEWRANKAQNQAQGITEKAYVQRCRSGATTGSSSPSAAPTQSRVAPAPRATLGSASPAAANEFSSEAQAKARCPSGTVVWANLKSHIYHFEGSNSFGHTKSGAYMCEQDANSAGMRAAKNEKQR
jgi:hypothetical protein